MRRTSSPSRLPHPDDGQVDQDALVVVARCEGVELRAAGHTSGGTHRVSGSEAEGCRPSCPTPKKATCFASLEAASSRTRLPGNADHQADQQSLAALVNRDASPAEQQNADPGIVQTQFVDGAAELPGAAQAAGNAQGAMFSVDVGAVARTVVEVVSETATSVLNELGSRTDLSSIDSGHKDDVQEKNPTAHGHSGAGLADILFISPDAKVAATPVTPTPLLWSPRVMDEVAFGLAAALKLPGNPGRSLLLSGPVHALFGPDAAGRQRPIAARDAALYMHSLFSDCWVLHTGALEKVAAFDLHDPETTFARNPEGVFDVAEQGTTLCAVVSAPGGLLVSVLEAARRRDASTAPQKPADGVQAIAVSQPAVDGGAPTDIAGDGEAESGKARECPAEEPPRIEVQVVDVVEDRPSCAPEVLKQGRLRAGRWAVRWAVLTEAQLVLYERGSHNKAKSFSQAIPLDLAQPKFTDGSKKIRIFGHTGAVTTLEAKS
eukprot:m51a1_g12949 hypothetical protein (491) ;mRNA; r:812-2723